MGCVGFRSSNEGGFVVMPLSYLLVCIEHKDASSCLYYIFIPSVPLDARILALTWWEVSKDGEGNMAHPYGFFSSLLVPPLSFFGFFGFFPGLGTGMQEECAILPTFQSPVPSPQPPPWLV